MFMCKERGRVYWRGISVAAIVVLFVFYFIYENKSSLLPCMLFSNVSKHEAEVVTINDSITSPNCHDFLVFKSINNSPHYSKKEETLFDNYIRQINLHFDKKYRLLGERRDSKTIQHEYSKMSKYWKAVHGEIGKGKKLYQNDFNVDLLIRKMKYSRIINITFFRNRPTLKWLLTLDGGQTVLFKPDVEDKNSNCLLGCEHPKYEVTGFTINRMLGLNSMPFTTGRDLDWFKEIKPIASKEFTKMFNVYTSNNNTADVCLKWKCAWLSEKVYCFSMGRITGSVMYYVNGDILEIENYLYDENQYSKFHPMYYRSRDHKIIAQKLKPGDSRVCDLLRLKPPYNDTDSFVHLLDMAVEDFLTQSRNSKHTILYLNSSEKPLMNVVIDKGKGFCQYHDDLLLAPVYQCCKIRKSLYETLVELNKDFMNVFTKLTHLENSEHLVTPDQINAIPRKIQVILRYVNECFTMKGRANVLIDC